MLITAHPGADARRILGELGARGLWARRLDGGPAVHFLVETHSPRVAVEEILAIEGVASVATAPSPHPRLDAQARHVPVPPRTVAGTHGAAAGTVGGTSFGAGAPPVLLAGPCSVESEGQIRGLAAALAALGVRWLRGGAWKPRTSPYAFQGHGDRALGWMRRAADEHGMQVVTEVLAEGDVGPIAEVADLLQIGARNMHNHALLKAVARAGRPVLLKRGLAATVEEWLLGAEYLLVHGAASVILCERGIRSFDPSTRNLLDLGAVALLAHAHGLPVIVDPSHATGRRDLVLPLAEAALAAGAAGVMIEVHDDPARALSDGPQALPPAALAGLAARLAPPHAPPAPRPVALAQGAR